MAAGSLVVVKAGLRPLAPDADTGAGSAETPTPARDNHAEAAAERGRFSYEGHRLPLFVIAIWIAFFVFGLAYFVKHLT